MVKEDKKDNVGRSGIMQGKNIVHGCTRIWVPSTRSWSLVTSKVRDGMISPLAC